MASNRPFSAPDGTWPLDQWPIDVVRTDPTGEIDLAQLEYNLSLTTDQRIQELQRLVDFVELVRESGRLAGAADRGTAQTPE